MSQSYKIQNAGWRPSLDPIPEDRIENRYSTTPDERLRLLLIRIDQLTERLHSIKSQVLQQGIQKPNS